MDQDQDKREPDVSTNVPHGLDTEPGGPADVEREMNRQENESVERARESQETPTTLRSGEAKPKSTIDRLNDFQRGELASVETYELALHAIKDSELRAPLQQIRDSHERRVSLLRERIRALGGEPAHGSGAWGAFARALQRGADLLGQRVALAALEEGEDQVKKRYLRAIDDLQTAEREFVERDLLNEQIRTHDLARSLQKFVKAA